MYFNTQENIITRLAECLENKLVLRKKVVENLVSIVTRIILAETTVVSKIAEKLKENFSKGTEESKIKKIQRFLNKEISDNTYSFFIEEVLRTFKAEDNKVVIIFEHTTCEDRFVILNFMLSIELFEYIDKKLECTYYIRLQGGTIVRIAEDEVSL